MQLEMKHKRLILIAWIVVWIALVLLLISYWHTLSSIVAWPLAVFEAYLIPDLRIIRAKSERRKKQTN
jgi:Flp pilus assembly protein TadB